MVTDIKFQDIFNLTTITTTILTSEYDTNSTKPTDNDDLKRILSYTIPLSCLALILILLVVVAICHRHRILEKWISLKGMRNTNPKFYLSTGLRRDSEFDSYNHENVKSTTMNQDNSQDYRLTTML